jgi:hypothetical protein
MAFESYYTNNNEESLQSYNRSAMGLIGEQIEDSSPNPVARKFKGDGSIFTRKNNSIASHAISTKRA